MPSDCVAPSAAPGAIYVDATLEMICTPHYTEKVRRVTSAVRAAVLGEYGLPVRSYGRSYEVDHIVSLELGGSNDIANLYPEAASPEPGYRVKDRLENRLHSLVCNGEIKLRQVQRATASNWVELYAKVYGTSP